MYADSEDKLSTAVARGEREPQRAQIKAINSSCPILNHRTQLLLGSKSLAKTWVKMHLALEGGGLVFYRALQICSLAAGHSAALRPPPQFIGASDWSKVCAAVLTCRHSQAVTLPTGPPHQLQPGDVPCRFVAGCLISSRTKLRSFKSGQGSYLLFKFAIAGKCHRVYCLLSARRKELHMRLPRHTLQD